MVWHRIGQDISEKLDYEPGTRAWRGPFWLKANNSSSRRDRVIVPQAFNPFEPGSCTELISTAA